MSWLDALLGNLLSNGVAVDAEGALNATDGLEIVANPGAGRNDLRPNAALRTMATRSADIRLRAVGSVTGGGTTTIDNSEYIVLGGTYVAGSNDTMLQASTTAARVTYTGADAVRALVLVSCTVSCLDAQDTALTLFAAGSPLSDVAASIQVTQLKQRFTACALTTLAQNQAVDLRAVGSDMVSEDLVIAGLSLVVIILGAV